MPRESVRADASPLRRALAGSRSSFLVPSSPMIDITVNGEPRSVPPDLTVDALLRRLGRDPSVQGVAVAVADRVVRRADWPARTVEAGERVEIITAAQGG